MANAWTTLLICYQYIYLSKMSRAGSLGRPSREQWLDSPSTRGQTFHPLPILQRNQSLQNHLMRNWNPEKWKEGGNRWRVTPLGWLISGFRKWWIFQWYTDKAIKIYYRNGCHIVRHISYLSARTAGLYSSPKLFHVSLLLLGPNHFLK